MDPLLVAKFFVQLLGVQPRDIQSTMMTLAARWTAGTPGAYDTDGREGYKTLQVGYDHFFYEVSGFTQLIRSDETDEFTGEDDFTRVCWNIDVKSEGWNGQILDAPNNMGGYLSTEGAGPSRSLLPGFYHFGEKAQVQLWLSPEELDPDWIGATRTLGVQLTGVKVASSLITADVRASLERRMNAAD